MSGRGGHAVAARGAAARSRRLLAAVLAPLLVPLLPPLLALAALFAGPATPAALGACASPPTMAEAAAAGAVVFVGSVVYLENDNRWATVQVEERWQGAGQLGATVEVHGSGDPGVQTQIDRSYETARYLFVVQDGPGYLVDNACSGTVAWSDALARLRPPGVAAAPGLAVSTPLADIDPGIVLPLIALLTALAIAVISYLVILRARRRPPDWLR